MAINVPLNAQLQNATQLQQQIQNAVNSVQLNLGGSGGKRALTSLSQPLGRLTGQADEFTKSLDAANARVLAFGASVGVLNAITNAFKAMVNTTIMVEKTLADINVVFGKSSSEIKNFGKGIFDVAKQTGQSFEEVSKAALEFSRQGLSVEDTLARTKDALVLTRLTGLDTARAVEGLTATINSFSKEALTSSEIINKLAAVDQKFAVSAADLTEALSRSASVAQNAGVGFEELIGIVAALQERTARGGAVIGNSLKTIFTRVRESDTLRELNRLGVAIEDINTKKLLSASEILKNLSKNAQAFGEVQKSDIFKDVGGGFQINQLIALLDDYSSAQSKAAQAQGVATGATNQAYVANEKLNQTISALINSSIEGLKELGATLGDLGIADSIKNALGVVNGFIESVQSLMEGDGAGAKFAQGIVKGIGSVLSGPGLALFGVIISKLIIDLGRFAVQGLKTFLGIGKAASEQKALQEAIVITLSRNAALQSQIGKFQGNAVAQASILAGLYNQQEASLRRQNAIASGMSSVLFRQGMRAGPEGFTQKGRAAGGYLPSAEAADVSRGVGGASPSAQVVSIPNFAFGNGQRGTMIANTSEYIVPNYANGGSAIFNQDMVSSMGLPAGAQKIRAARGYVPNFAQSPKSAQDIKRVGAQKGGTISVDASDIGMINISPKETKTKASLLGSQIPKIKSNHPNYLDTTFNLQGLQISDGLQRFRKNTTEDADLTEFGQELNEYLTLPIVQFAQDLFKDLPDMGTPKSTFLDDVKQELKSTQTSLLSKSAQGDIFEKSISLALMGFKDVSKESSIFTNSENSPFDFDPNGPASQQISKYFFGPKKIIKADAKRSNSTDARNSFLKKMFNDALTYGRIQKDLPEVNELGDQKIKASRGYIPNFANKALTDSINREKIESGLPISAISVTQDSRLMNSRNPTGLAVINSRDEPNGKIPNFAAQSPAPTPLTAADFNITKAATKALSSELDNLNKEIKKFTIEVSKGTKTEAEAKAALDNFVKGLTNAKGKVLLSPSAQQKVQDVAGRRLSESVAQNPAPVAKGFGDVVGKIFLFQTALSFATGAAGELTSSAEKLAAKFSETLTNVASFGLLGQQLLQSNPAGALAKFGKSLGLVGLGVGALYEGFKLADFAIKEFSGENAKVASSLAKLNDASKTLAIKFEELSENRQLELKTEASKILGSAGFKSFFGGLTGSIQGGGTIGGDPKAQEGVAKLLAQGASQKDIDKLFEDIKNKNTRDVKTSDALGNIRTTKIDTTQLSDVLQAIQENFISGLGKELSEKYKRYQTSIAGLDLTTEEGKATAKQRAAKAYGVNDFTELTDEQEALIEDANKSAEYAQKLAEEQRQSQNEINLGKRISVDIAKQEIDSAIELKRLGLEKASTAENDIKLKIATLKLSEREKIIYESNLKDLELQKKVQSEILDITKGGLDKALEANSINVDLGALEKMRDLLVKIDLSKIDFNKIDFMKPFKGQSNALYALENQLITVGNISRDQAKTIIESIGKQALAKTKYLAKQKDINAEELTQLLEIDKVNQALQSQLSIFDRIAQKAQSLANLKISFGNLGIAENQAKITEIQSKIDNANTTPAQKEQYQKDIIALQKLNNELKKGNQLQDFRAKKAGIERDISKTQTDLDSALKLPLDKQNQTQIDNLRETLDGLNRQKKAAANEYKGSIITIDAETNALSAQEKQIGQVTGAYASLIKQLYEFRKGAGERIASANMGLLSAVDPNALANSTIQRQVEMEAQAQGQNLSDEEYYKLVQTETPILQKQFELSVETSRVRRTELENEIELMREIAAISAATDEERLAKIKAIVDARNEEAQSFGAGFEKGVGALQDKTQRFRSEIGEQIPQLFSDNLAQGLNDAISGAKSLKDALRDAATSFFNAITKANIENIANRVTGGIGSFFTGKAAGGMISGGSGTKDDVPAMLMGGEYVVKKSAVKKYGSNFLDSLNQGKLSGYATGGAVQSGKGGFYAPGEYGQGAITGQRQLLDFATQDFTSGQFDQMGSYGMTGASINLEAESGRLTMAGRENSPIFERTQQAKEEAFQVYLQSLKVDEQYRNQLKEMEEAEKARKKQLVTSIAMAVASSAASYGASAFGTGATNAVAEAGAKAPLTFTQRLSTGLSGGFKNLGAAIMPGGAKPTFQLNDFAQANRLKMPVSNFRAMQSSRGAQGYSPYLPSNTFSGGVLNTGGNSNNGGNELLPNAEYIQKDLFAEIDKRYRANGGPILGGSGVRDDVPAMLTGGEFVLNNRATKKIGMSNLQRLNSGDTSSQQDPEKGSSDLMQALISKLDELISATSKSGGDNVVVNVNSNEAQGERNNGQQSANEKDLHKKIKAAVLEVITQEKRLGGSLNK